MDLAGLADADLAAVVVHEPQLDTGERVAVGVVALLARRRRGFEPVVEGCSVEP